SCQSTRVLFFFSSRRRHTRFSRDWSSDVCSSDLKGSRVLSWDGVQLRETPVPDGVHMIAHDDLDDPRTARIEAWLPLFAGSRPDDDGWAERWIDVLGESATLSPDDDRAIIRDNNPHGYPTMSLLFCTAEVSRDTTAARSHVLARPGQWGVI